MHERFSPRLTIEGLVARGGSCDVLRAIDPRTGERFALKWLLEDCARDATARASFEHEATLLARCGHESLPTLRGRIELEGRPALVLAWIEAKPVESGSRWDVRECVRVATQALDALTALHALADDVGPLDVVHRDVNPSNVMVTADHARATLIDLGLASSRLLPRAPDALSEGTIGYHAPELFTGEAPIDARADVFGLAIVVWEMLAGRRLFPRDRFAAANAIVDRDAPDVREARGDVPEALAFTLREALARDPRARIATAGALSARLRAAG
jgi:serine/threonine protein kinase